MNERIRKTRKAGASHEETNCRLLRNELTGAPMALRLVTAPSSAWQVVTRAYRRRWCADSLALGSCTAARMRTHIRCAMDAKHPFEDESTNPHLIAHLRFYHLASHACDSFADH